MEVEDLKSLINDPSADADADMICIEALDVLDNGEDWEKAKLADFLSELMMTDGAKIAKANPQAYDDYQYYILALALSTFASLSEDDQATLLKQRMLAAVGYGIDLNVIPEQYYELYYTEESVANAFKEFSDLLMQNQESLGAAPLEIDGKKYLPQLRYWILDYTKFPTKVAKRTALERVNYINTGYNTRQLTQIQRSHLVEVLSLYDTLVNPPFDQINLREFVYIPTSEEDSGTDDLENVPELKPAQPQIAPKVNPRPEEVKAPMAAPALPKSEQKQPVTQNVFKPEDPLAEIIRREKAIQVARHDALIQQKLDNLKKKVSK
jgi:hypothetical protein